MQPHMGAARYGAFIGEDPALVGMTEMFVDVETDEPDAWKILYVYVDGRRHRGVR